MEDRILLLDDFVRKLQREAPLRLTWLIGAGMSRSAGVPVAEDVSRRVILFDHLCDLSDQSDSPVRPWDGSSLAPVTYATDFEDFLTWYDNCEGESDFERLFQASLESIRRKKGFENISPEHPQCYPLLFAQTFLNYENAHRVLTALVRRARTVNLAHLALAGLLRDFHGTSENAWCHTVFTTNFDDLLLKALLALNHTARVFGEIKSADRPELHPTYPQIVHLHGRHTGYRLANTKAQFKQIDSSLREGFSEHLRSSHLIVLGYSGWDDMAMEVLHEWRNDDNKLKGLFWVPYQSERNLLKSTERFITQCPPHRAYVIVNPERTLDADSFMLAMCRVANRKAGFSPYRKGILEYAKQQHHFTLDQLNQHPSDNPLLARELAREAVELCLKREYVESARCVKDAVQRLEPDLPRSVRADTSFSLGVAAFLANDYTRSIKHLTEAVELRGNSRVPRRGQPGLQHAHLALGIANLRAGDSNAAQLSFKYARRQAERENDNEGKANSLIWSAVIALRRYPIESTMSFLEDALKTIPRLAELSRAEIHRLMGDCLRCARKFSEAKDEYETALDIYGRHADLESSAMVLKSLGDTALAEGSPEAKERYEEALSLFAHYSSDIGVAIAEHGMGDFYFHSHDFGSAMARYQTAYNAYDRLQMRYAACTAKADLIKTLFELRNDPTRLNRSELDIFEQLLRETRELAEETSNRYARTTIEKIDQSRTKLQKGDGKETQ